VTPPASDAILDVTAELLTEVGIDGLQLRDVARRARVSLSTIYKHFGSRDELVVVALERWMAHNVYKPLPSPRPGEPLGDVLIRLFRHLFAPWKRNPTMLKALVRATASPGGRRLTLQGKEAVRAAGYFDGYEDAYVEDLMTILTHLTRGLTTNFASGQIGVAEIIRVHERAVRRLTADAPLGRSAPRFESAAQP
jgi:AcrR family transcriptional regulator